MNRTTDMAVNQYMKSRETQRCYQLNLSINCETRATGYKRNHPGMKKCNSLFKKKRHFIHRRLWGCMVELFAKRLIPKGGYFKSRVDIDVSLPASFSL